MRCGLACCSGAKSTRFFIIPVISFSHVHAILSRLQCNTTDLPSGHWVLTLPSQYPGYQRKPSTRPLTSNDSCMFFWSWRWCWHPLHDCRLVSGSYVNTHVSSQVIIEFNKSGSFSMLCKMSKHNSFAMFFLFIWQQFWNHFCTKLSHVQFFP